MEIVKKIKRSRKRITAFLLAFLMAANPLFPAIAELTAYAFAIPEEGKTGNLHLNVDSWCIDDSELVGGGLWTTSDIYQRVSSSELGADQGPMFWLGVGLKAHLGDPSCLGLIKVLNDNGIPAVPVDEKVFKRFLHSPAVRAANAWADAAAANAETILTKAGYLSSGAPSVGGTTVSGKTIPFSDGFSEGSPHDFGTGEDKTKYVISYSPSEADFFNAVQGNIEYCVNGAWVKSANGWTVNNTGSSIEFIKTGEGDNISLFRFTLANTEYASAGGSSTGMYASPEALYNSCLVLYRCVICSGAHKTRGNQVSPLSEHQRHADVEIVAPTPSGDFYFSFGNPDPQDFEPNHGSITFKLYYHEEDWESNYNVRLVKYDYETGRKLEGAKFRLGERFDDYGKVDQENDGHVTVHAKRDEDTAGDGGEYRGGYETSEPDWTDDATFRKVDDFTTDADGYVGTDVQHRYHYEKTFCDGHPAPQFAVIPEPVFGEEGEGDGEPLNQDEIDQTIEENKMLANAWLSTVEACEQKAGEREGVHFHWVMDTVLTDVIEQTAEDGGEGLEGEAPDAGTTESASGEESYENSGCREDCSGTYDRFINLKYSYAWQELAPAEGYISHLVHADDIPIEIITTNASEAGAHSSFAGEYSHEIEIKEISSGGSAPLMLKTAKPEAVTDFSLKNIRFSVNGSTIDATDLFEEAGEKKTKVASPSEAGLSVLERDGVLFNDLSDELPEGAEEATPADALYQGSAGKETGEKHGFIEEAKAFAGRLFSFAAPITAYANELPETYSEAVEAALPEEVAEDKEEEAEPAVSETEETPVKEAEHENNTEEVKEESPKEEDPEEEASLSGTEDTPEKETEKEPEAAEEEIIAEVEEVTELPADENDGHHMLTVIDPEIEVFAEVPEEEEMDLFDTIEGFFGGLFGGLLGAGADDDGETDIPQIEEDLFSPQWYPTEEAGEPLSDLGSHDLYSHCSSSDDETSENAPTEPGNVEDNTWRVYDHRFEGEITINKRDFSLIRAESSEFDSYAETNGDGTLEGAVYGLFAKKTIEHPDRKTGVLFKANELVSVATTDRDGNATFSVITEAPATTYSYVTGEKTVGTRAVKNNLYTGYSHDDYTPDGKYERTYPDNEKLNGNCWIGRPLLVGEYYIKELSRSEGYELSIEKKLEPYTNRGESFTVGFPETDATVKKTKKEVIDATVTDFGSGTPEYGNPVANEYTFDITSSRTDGSYDLVFTDLPEGAKLYRLDSYFGPVSGGMVPSGDYVWQDELDAGGNRIPVTAGANQYPVYEGGAAKKESFSVDKYADSLVKMSNKDFSSYAAKMAEVLSAELPKNPAGTAKFSEAQVAAILTSKISDVSSLPDDGTRPSMSGGLPLTFIKTKTEAMLRVVNIHTPQSEEGAVRPKAYTAYDYPVYNEGNVSKKVPGNPVETIKITQAGLTVGDLITSIVSFYESHPYYNYGGIDSIVKSGDTYTVRLYTGISGNYPVLVSKDGKNAVLDMVTCQSSDPSVFRKVIAVYTEDGSDFDGYEAFSSYSGLMKSGYYKATLSPQALAGWDGTKYVLTSRIETRDMYYPEGTSPVYDRDGHVIYKGSYVPVLVPASRNGWKYTYKKLAEKTGPEDEWVVKVSSSYTDTYGAVHSDTAEPLVMNFLVTIDGDYSNLSHELTAEEADAARMHGKNWNAGYVVTLADYALYVLGAEVTPYADYAAMALPEDSFVMTAELRNNADTEKVVTTVGTVGVLERPIRQRIAVKKDIALDADEDGNGKGDSYRHNTYGSAIETAVPDFTFKAYLKSNIERLYRAEDGTVRWTDVNGNTLTPHYYDRSGNEVTEKDAYSVKWVYDEAFGKKTVRWPEIDTTASGTDNPIDSLNVQPIYTVTSHETGSKTTGRISNNVFNQYEDPEEADADAAGLDPFTTALRDKDGEGVSVNAALYSYAGKNADKKESDRLKDSQNKGYTRILETVSRSMEDNASMRTVETYNYEKFFAAIETANHDKWDDADPTYTSYHPVGNRKNRSEASIKIAERSDMVRQFAIDWYLEDEVAKRVKRVPASFEGGKYTEDEAKKALKENGYSEALYDEALLEAIIKAENYLKPFFLYDLDTIYSLKWDTETDGGADSDTSTLAAGESNTKLNGEDEFTGLSAYLPYGTYVVVEQQPGYKGLSETFIEYLQKHYRKDAPKEVLVPSLYDGTVNDTADNYAQKYTYDADMSAADQQKASNYLIRFNEEWKAAGDDQRKWVISAHSHYGNFEVYPYGLDIDRISGGSIPCPGGSKDYKGFSISQDSGEPLKDYYGTAHRTEKKGFSEVGEELGGNAGSGWDLEGMTNPLKPMNGDPDYDYGNLRNRTYYGSVSEDAGTAQNVLMKNGTATEDNASGMTYSDGVRSMTGVLTAYDKKYAQMLVPWSVTDSVSMNIYSGMSFSGYADVNEMNRFYYAKLRLEKLDSETHENILHDDALFAVYRAEHDPVTGEVLFYDSDTEITGSKEFVTAYCMRETVMPVDPENPRGEYQGTVKAGTPVCKEADRIILGDRFGNQVSEFKSYSTENDILAKTEKDNASPREYLLQDTGYIEFPQPLGAGTYVLVEEKAPSGYVRTAPVAVEIYSDKVTYYKEGHRDERIMAALFEEETSDDKTLNGNKPQDTVDLARIYIEDAPIKLTFEKIKESSAVSADKTSDKTVTYRASGRVDGKLADLSGRDDLVYVYRNGRYQGYAYKKGTLEYLANLKALYEADSDPLTKVEIVYDGTEFAGYGYVTRPLETADDGNKYVAGATMTLFDALQLRRNEDYEFGKSDYSFSFPAFGKNHALIIERDLNSNVTRMYVEKGYAGVTTEFIPETGADGKTLSANYRTGYTKDGKPVYENGYIWKTQTVEREDTDILFYGLDSLDIFCDENVDGNPVHYGYNRQHNKVDIRRLESDRQNYEKSDAPISIIAFKGGVPFLEISGGDLTKVKYSSLNKTLSVDPDTVIYHLDEDGNRDAMVDPYTGMAYVTETCDDGKGGTFEKFLVWAVNVHRDEYGNVIARDKITTSRVATVGENSKDGLDPETGIKRSDDPSGKAVDGTAGSFRHDESGSVTGSFEALGSGQSHQETTDRVNKYGENLNGETLLSDNNGDFVKAYDPVYDRYGNIIYYQRSDETYDKGTDLYDRNGDFVRYQDSDGLSEYNAAAYRINEESELFDTEAGDISGELVPESGQDNKELYHRYGEGYVLQNTWVTSDRTPNDPFDTKETDGQADILKRVPYGTYILEEVKAPESGSYTKGLPVGLTVNETVQMHYVKMVDDTTKLEIAKIDAASDYLVNVRLMDEGGTVTEQNTDDSVSYSYAFAEGAVVALYPAEKVYSADYEKYPKGYYLRKTGNEPAVYRSTEWTVSSPKMLTARWTVTADAPIYVEGIPQGFYLLCEDTVPEGFVTADPIEVEIGTSKEVLFILMGDDHTKVEIDKFCLTGKTKNRLKGAEIELHEAVTGSDGGFTYDASGNPLYKAAVLSSFVSSDEDEWSGFIPAFEAMYNAHGTDGSMLTWLDANGTERRADYVSHEELGIGLAGGSDTEFPSEALLTFRDDSGRIIRVRAYEEKTVSGKRAYSFDYQFDYKALPSVNKKADSYTTVSGIRRFNYLDSKKKYVAVEKKAPAGYTVAPPKEITVLDTKDILRYGIEDGLSRIIFSKVCGDGTKEYKGAMLALYKAGADGSFVKDDDHLLSVWASGSDGTYTAEDKLYGRIPAGYSVGDLRAHTITGLPAGTYYFAELDPTAYYTRFEPIRVVYDDMAEVRLVRAKNEPVEGRLIVTKTDEGGSLLKGARYELKTYENGNLRTPVKEETLTASDAVITVDSLPVGTPDSEGRITPYVYTLREISAPEGYRVSATVYRWSFDPELSDRSFAAGEKAEKRITVVNEKTRFYFSKKTFDSLCDDNTEGAFSEGAVLKIFRLSGISADGSPLYDSTSLVDEWTTKKAEKIHMTEGLIAGCSYVLIEEKAPSGWNIMKPVMFTVSDNGRSLINLTNKLSQITLNTIKPDSVLMDTENLDIDSILSATLRGRYVTKLTYTVTDKAGVILDSWTASGSEHVLDIENGYKDGESYTVTESALFSDGDEAVTAKTSQTMWFDAEGHFSVPVREPGKVTLSLRYSDGDEIGSFEPSADNIEFLIDNGIIPELPVVSMKSAGGRDGEALDPGKAIINTVTAYNPSHRMQDVTVEVLYNDETSIIDAGDGTLSGKKLSFVKKDAAPFEAFSFTFMTKAAGLSSKAEVLLKAEDEIFETVKEVPVLAKNRLIIINELTGSGKELYAGEETEFAVRLFNNETGMELSGSYEYSGKRSGTMKSGDRLSLKGNEFISIDPGVYDNVRYEVKRTADGRDITEENVNGSFGKTAGAYVLFTRNVKDTSEREIFRKGRTYELLETLSFTEGADYENRFLVTLSENGSANRTTVFDKPTKVYISKKDIAGDEELPGCEMKLYDEEGNEIDSWTSGEEPHYLEGVLEPGKTYRLVEENPAEGYSYAADVWFAVNEDGTVDTVTMVDKITRVEVKKTDAATGEEVPGCRLEIIDKETGEVVESWTSGENGEKEHVVEGLIAGKEYTLTERRPADGYYYADSIDFVIPLYGEIKKVEMIDYPIVVEVKKTDAVTGKEVPGCRLEVIEKETGKVIDSWTSGTEDHVVKGLKAETDYILSERRPADGYAYADNIEFSVDRTGKVAKKVVMVDETTKAWFYKTDIKGSEELEGFTLSVCDKDGNEIEKWVSGKEPHRIECRLIAGETYILKEVGVTEYGGKKYSFAEDVSFRVSEHGEIDRVYMKNDITHVEADKYKKGTKELIGGAKMQILDMNGNAVAEWTTEKDKVHVLDGVLKADTDYILHEVSAPSGFRLSEDVRFHTPKGKEKLTVAMEDAVIETYSGGGGGGGTPWSRELRISKVNDQNESLSGASIKAFASSGKELSVTSHGTWFSIRISSPDTVTVRESEVPKGYEAAEGEYHIKVAYSGAPELLDGDEFFRQNGSDLFQFILTNNRKVGDITASFDSDISGNGRYRIKRGDESFDVTRTGDTRPVIPAVILMVLSAAAIAGFAIFRRKKKKGKGEKLLMFLIFCAGLSITAFSGKAYASETHLRVITTEPFTDSEENHIPKDSFSDGGVDYVLLNYEVIDVLGEERKEEVSDVISYNGIPKSQEIPETAQITVEDPILEEELSVTVPLSGVTYSNERWENGFSFEITVNDYDAAVFMLGEKEVTLSEESPLSGYETELLGMIGVSGEDYRINEIRWDGEAYEADGVLKRKLTAFGEMRLVDCAAAYSGTVALPAVDAKAVRAVYKMEISENETVSESEESVEPLKPASELIEKEEENDPGLTGLLRRRWQNSDFRKKLEGSRVGRIIVGAVDWVLDTPGHLSLSLGGLSVLLFGSAVLFATAVKSKKIKKQQR